MTLSEFKSITISKNPSKFDFTPDGRRHLVYRISHLISKVHYYGSQTNNKILGESYFSSSSDESFISEQSQHPERFKYKVIKIYNNTSDKIIHEAYLHQFFDVKSHDKFYNKVNQTASGFDTTGISTMSKDEREKRSQRWSGDNNPGVTTPRKGELNGMYGSSRCGEDNPFFGKHHTQGTKDAISKANTGNRWNQTQETKDAMSNNQKGSVVALNTNTNLFETITKEEFLKLDHYVGTNKGKTYPKRKCPHCDKIGGGSNMTRYHFDNCKSKI